MNTHTVKPVRHGDEIEFEITSLAFGGDSVGRYQDFAIFVPGGLPGERVRVKITQVRDHYASGEILSVLRLSPDRVTPVCPIFEDCGGCQWQHFNYSAQLKTKRQFVVDSLQRIGHLPNVAVELCLPSANPYAYRNKAMPVLSMRDGHFISGIFEPRSHHLVPYHTCPIQGDPINDLIQKVLKKIDRSGLTPYQEKKHTGFLRHLAVRQGVKTGEMLLAFVTRTETPEERLQKPTLLLEGLADILPRVARELVSEIPGLVGVLQNVNPSRTNIVFGPTTNVLAGRDHYFEIIDDLKLKVSLKSFLQVNTPQADMLHAIVREALGEPVHKKKWGTVLDLYSGIGTLAMAVADKADYVVGVEEVGPAVEDARFNAELNRKSNIDYLEGDVAHILLGLKDKGLSQIDAAILDPPRKGVLPEVLARVTALHPERIIYVSCDPSTLARDLSLLVKHGFSVDWVQPLDMFPQTYHVETVVKLTRETPLPPEILTQTQQPELEPFRLNKPAEPSSLNVSANFTAFKENTATLLQAFSRQGSAGFQLGRSILSALFRVAGNGLRAFGNASLTLFQRTGNSSVKAAKESVAFLKNNLAEVLKEKPRESPPVSVANSVEIPSTLSPASPALDPPLVSMTTSTSETFTEPSLSQSAPPFVEEKETSASELSPDFSAAEMEELEKPPVFIAPVETEKRTPPLQKISEELSVAKVEELEKSPVFIAPVETEKKVSPSPEINEEFPAAVLASVPLETPAPASEKVSEWSPADLEREVLKELAPRTETSPFAQPAATLSAQPAAPEMDKPRIPWKWPAIPFPTEKVLSWFSVQRVRWALIAAFLLGGGFVAKATLSPSGKNTSALVPTVSQMIPDVIAVMPTRSFLRYEMVPFEVRVNPQEMRYFSQMHAAVEVFRAGEPIEMVDGRMKLSLKKDTASGKFFGNWPIPYNPAPGTYIAEVSVSAPQWTTPKTFETAFTIAPLKPQGLFPGYSALTMEGGKQLIGGAVPALDGSDSMRAANAIEWAKFMGANVYCYLMGQTSIWDHLIPKAYPFNRGDMEVGRRYGKYAHESGLKFAAYLTTYKVVGDAWNQASYDFSLGYDPDSDEVIQTRFISLDDPKRREDIVKFLKEMNEDPLVDMVGMDYVRTGFAGYEMVDEFVQDLSVPGPANFWSLSKQERIHWLAKTVELHESSEVVSLFEWWRAHKVALCLKSMLEEAKMTKPVFTFTLGWQMGHQHGQDPAMFVDAGVNYNHIMLYEGDRGTMLSMKRQWPEYLSRGNGMYAMGEMVDFNMVQKSIDPPGPEELYNREMETFQNWYPVNANVGMFWHDLYRLVYGIRGPYSTMEWVVAGGKAFSELQRAQGLSPIEVSVLSARNVPAGVPVPISVDVSNHSPESLKGMVLHQLDTSKNYAVDLATVGPFDVPAGSKVRIKSLFVNIPKEDRPERDNRYMAAVMVEKPGQTWRAFDFAYVHKLSPGAPVKHAGTTDEKDEFQDNSSKDSNRHR